MRKPNFLLVVIFALFFGACAENGDDLQLSEANQQTDPAIDRVLALANADMDRLYPQQTSRAGRRIARPDKVAAITNTASRSGEEDTLIYVVNYDDNRGYVLVSARDSEDPVLAVVPEGNYDPEVGSDNPGLNLFIDAAKGMIGNDGLVITPDPGNVYMIENGKFVKYEKSVVTHWGGIKRLGDNHHWSQESFYGSLCDNGYVGCGPLAMASIITYLRYVELTTDRIYYTYPKHDIAYEDIDWRELCLHKHEGYTDKETGVNHPPLCYEKDPETTHKTIARFCRQLGEDADADYRKDGTGTGIRRDAPIQVFKKYMPEFEVSKLQNFTSSATMRCIDRGLIYMRGNIKGVSEGHTWVSDGYDYSKIATTRYESEVPEKLTPPIQYNWQYAGTSYHEISKNHILWGWGGKDDGWYSGNVFETHLGSYTDFQYISVTKGM